MESPFLTCPYTVHLSVMLSAFHFFTTGRKSTQNLIAFHQTGVPLSFHAPNPHTFSCFENRQILFAHFSNGASYYFPKYVCLALSVMSKTKQIQREIYFFYFFWHPGFICRLCFSPMAMWFAINVWTICHSLFWHVGDFEMEAPHHSCLLYPHLPESGKLTQFRRICRICNILKLAKFTFSGLDMILSPA